MALQVFADDSSDDNSGIVVLAGYVAPQKVWDEFSPRWAAACSAPKGIRYFKMNDARGLKNQFEGWSEGERDDKVTKLAQVIWDFRDRIGGIGVTTTRALYRELIAPHVRRRAVRDDPYYLMATALCGMCEHQCGKLGVPGIKIDFFFDNQGKTGARFKRRFDAEFKKKYPILGEFLQVDDRLYRPLQAADMFAWRLRNGVSLISTWTVADKYLDAIPCDLKHLDREFLTGFVPVNDTANGNGVLLA